MIVTHWLQLGPRGADWDWGWRWAGDIRCWGFWPVIWALWEYPNPTEIGWGTIARSVGDQLDNAYGNGGMARVRLWGRRLGWWSGIDRITMGLGI